MDVTYKLRLEHTFEVHRKYMRYILKVDYLMFFLSAIFKSTNKEKAGRAILPTRQDWFQILEQRLRHY
jgi:hypothetical protein